MIVSRKTFMSIGAAALFATGLWAGIGSAGPSGANGETVGLTATLVASKEVPKPKGVSSRAGGRFTATLVRRGSGGAISWRLTFHNLTGKAVGAHIHRAKPGVSGPIIVLLCGPCRSGVRGTAKVKAATVRALLHGGAYVNVHTTKNPAGEIRGQVKSGVKPTLPPPSTTGTTTTTTTSPYP